MVARYAGILVVRGVSLSLSLSLCISSLARFRVSRHCVRVVTPEHVFSLTAVSQGPVDQECEAHEEDTGEGGPA